MVILPHPWKDEDSATCEQDTKEEGRGGRQTFYNVYMKVNKVSATMLGNFLQGLHEGGRTRTADRRGRTRPAGRDECEPRRRKEERTVEATEGRKEDGTRLCRRKINVGHSQNVCVIGVALKKV
jgi:hypothetical protein